MDEDAWAAPLLAGDAVDSLQKTKGIYRVDPGGMTADRADLVLLEVPDHVPFTVAGERSRLTLELLGAVFTKGALARCVGLEDCLDTDRLGYGDQAHGVAVAARTFSMGFDIRRNTAQSFGNGGGRHRTFLPVNYGCYGRSYPARSTASGNSVFLECCTIPALVSVANRIRREPTELFTRAWAQTPGRRNQVLGREHNMENKSAQTPTPEETHWLNREGNRKRTHFSRGANRLEWRREQALRDWYGAGYCTEEILAHQTSARTVSDVVTRVLTKIGKREMALLESVRHQWADCVGADIARQSTPATIRRGTLEVEVRNSSWLYILKWERKAQIQVKLEALTNGEISDVRFVPAGRYVASGAREPGNVADEPKRSMIGDKR